MRAIKHAFLSLIRKPTKAIMIFVILFVVYGLVFTGIIIKNSVNSSKVYVRKELGAVVEMKADYMKAMEDQLSQADYTKLNLSASLAREIAKDPLVKDLYITEITSAGNEDLKSAVNLGGGSEGGQLSVATVGSASDLGSSFMVIGSSSDTPQEFDDGTYKITQGRLRGKEDEGKDTLLISEEFAGKNNLAVGDSVELTSSVDKQTYSFEITGIFKGSSSFMVDQMYTSLESAKKLSGTQSDDSKAASVSFRLKDPMDIDKFIDRHKKQMPNDYITLYASDNEYKSLTRPLDLISTVISILLVVVFAAGAIIMLAIITIFVRDRKFEIGLLLSSGEGKQKILSQFLLEILAVSVIAFTVAAAASRFSADYAASWIVKNQLVEENTKNTGGAISFAIGGAEKNQVKISDVAKEFNVSVDGEVVYNLLLISFGLVILSAGAPLLIILSYKPRESLQN
ncbi:FtsX-like permease family protein [Anaerocolumna sp. AGMB13025]|uniref:ABC transporter permease n=1 Tax=Anaerocolumna sp. AGMB13025 TaxID=3039116 RepID=UPI00241F0270|nr:FtsX-like permease family protein [Anaerocolumna sp. AGMB13025]WFR55708.1 FtsX-like permease family protein [Anaerocolumna sp. AGMB13025]